MILELRGVSDFLKKINLGEKLLHRPGRVVKIQHDSAFQANSGYPESEAADRVNCTYFEIIRKRLRLEIRSALR